MFKNVEQCNLPIEGTAGTLVAHQNKSQNGLVCKLWSRILDRKFVTLNARKQ